jgi:hypothetical protein
MNIRKYEHIKDVLEDRLDHFNCEVRDRWNKLNRNYFGRFNSWCIENDIVCLQWTSEYNSGCDEIPIKFFEMENEYEAIEEYELYRIEQKRIEKEKKLEENKRQVEEAEKRQLEYLKKKYEGNK